MLVRVVKPNGDNIGTMEIDEVPAVGDLFFWQNHGPYKVRKRTWRFQPDGDQERATLEVEQD